jgi:hypothetical protein
MSGDGRERRIVGLCCAEKQGGELWPSVLTLIMLWQRHNHVPCVAERSKDSAIGKVDWMAQSGVPGHPLQYGGRYYQAQHRDGALVATCVAVPLRRNAVSTRSRRSSEAILTGTLTGAKTVDSPGQTGAFMACPLSLGVRFRRQSRAPCVPCGQGD